MILNSYPKAEKILIFPHITEVQTFVLVFERKKNNGSFDSLRIKDKEIQFLKRRF